MPSATDFKDYYAILGVSKTATAEEIKRAYRKLARQHHPDLNPGNQAAEEKFKEINEAQEVLSDPEKRSKYDQYGQYWQQAAQRGPTASRAALIPQALILTNMATLMILFKKCSAGSHLGEHTVPDLEVTLEDLTILLDAASLLHLIQKLQLL